MVDMLRTLVNYFSHINSRGVAAVFSAIALSKRFSSKS